MIDVFDQNLVYHHRWRAARQHFQHDFLFHHNAALLQERLSDFTRPFQKILEIGCRDGHFTQLLRQQYPNANIAVMDCANWLSQDQAKRSFSFQIMDTEVLSFPANTFDLIVSNLYLHWVNDLPGYLAQIYRCLKPDGLFLGSLLGQDTLSELRQSLMQAELELCNGASPRVSPFAGLQDIAELMQRAGFALPVIDMETVQVTYRHLVELLRDLQNMGEANALIARRKHIPPRLLFPKAAKIYPQQPDGQITARFDIIHLCGWSPHESQQKPLKRGSGKNRLADVLK